MTNFIDESPERYGPMNTGDYGPMKWDKVTHFILLAVAKNTVMPLHSACGKPLPNWQKNPKKYPIAGIVNCKDCLDIAEYARQLISEGGNEGEK